MNRVRLIVLYFLAPTYCLIGCLKKGLSKERKTRLLRNWSRGATILTIAAVAAILISERYATVSCWIKIGLGILGIWRVNEIVFAFFKDAYDRLSDKAQTTEFRPPERLRFVAASYLEMIVCFGFVYLGLQSALASLPTPAIQAFKSPLVGLADAIYLSSTIVTTLGYGESEPVAWLAKILTIWEVFSGLILFAIALAVYLGAEKSSPGAAPISKPQGNSPAVSVIDSRDTMIGQKRT